MSFFSRFSSSVLHFSNAFSSSVLISASSFTRCSASCNLSFIAFAWFVTSWYSFMLTKDCLDSFMFPVTGCSSIIGWASMFSGRDSGSSGSVGNSGSSGGSGSSIGFIGGIVVLSSGAGGNGGSKSSCFFLNIPQSMAFLRLLLLKSF